MTNENDPVVCSECGADLPFARLPISAEDRAVIVCEDCRDRGEEIGYDED